MADATPTLTKSCPNCGAEMDVYRGFVTWCLKCDYGIEGDRKEEKKKNRFEKLFVDLGKQQSQVVFNQIIKDKAYQPTWSRTRLLIYFLAATVHLVSFALLVAGLLLLVTRWNNIILLLIALFCLALAWYLGPKPIPEPKENVLTRAEHPALYALVDQIAKSLGTHIDQIVVNEWFSASYSKTGLQQKNTLTLGLPLWEILDHQERIALLAHEIAHAVNGDASRGLFVGTAIQSLTSWYGLVVPEPLVDPATNTMNIPSIPIKLVAAGVAGMIWAYYRLLTILLYRDMQRAEYLADRLGASIGECDAFITMLRKLLFFETFMIAIQHCALDRRKSDLYQELHELIEDTPENEIERRWRLEDRNMTQMDVSHPPIGLRIKMLNAQESQAPKITAETETFGMIDQQLSSLRTKIQAKLIGNYRAAIS